MKLYWCNDIHLDHAIRTRKKAFLKSLKELPEGSTVVVCGDISNGTKLRGHLEAIAKTGATVYFVLGNHDFYGSSIKKEREVATDIMLKNDNLTYLTAVDMVVLPGGTALIGHDGWYDAKFGRISRIALNDFRLIQEIAIVGPYSDPYGSRGSEQLMHIKFEELSVEAAEAVKARLNSALDKHDRAIVATHVPPFPEAAWYDGKMSSLEWLPYFSSKAMGDAMLEVMDERPDKSLLVLCGHTHGGGEVKMRDNLRVLTGPAIYGYPKLNDEAIDTELEETV